MVLFKIYKNHLFTGQVVITGSKQMCENHINEFSFFYFISYMSKIFDKYFSPKIHYLKMNLKNNCYTLVRQVSS